MGSMNKAILIGNLGRDAELRYTNDGTPVATLNMATTETWKDKGGQRQEKTEWHRVVIWGNVAEALAEYLLKGKQVAIEGKITTRKWTDKDGNDKYTTEIRADRVTLLGGGGNERSEQKTSGRSGNKQGRNSTRRPQRDDGPDDPLPGDDGPSDDDDVPF